MDSDSDNGSISGSERTFTIFNEKETLPWMTEFKDFKNYKRKGFAPAMDSDSEEEAVDRESKRCFADLKNAIN